MIVFVSDFFVEQYLGGAELTLEALIDESPFETCKIPSHKITKTLIDQNKNKFWIFGNIGDIPESLLLYIAKNINYSIVECDYKLCKYRLLEIHAKQEKQECDCSKKRYGKVRAIFFSQAKKIWWMSKAQKQIYLKQAPFLSKTPNSVLSSVFDEKTIKKFETLNTSTKQKNDTWLIQQSEFWVKGKQQSIEYAETNGLKYEILERLSYEQMLEKLASAKGVISKPQGADTCPRFVIEAKILGCELAINENVQHKNEDWFIDKKTIIKYLKAQKKEFWKETEQIINEIVSEFFNTHTFSFACPSYNEGYRLKRFLVSCLEIKGLNEIHVVNHRSSDETEEILKEMKTVYNNSSKRLLVTYEKRDFSKNFTMADLRNVAVQTCSNDVVYSVDADWVFGPNFIYLMYAAYGCLLHKDVYGVGHEMYSIDEYVNFNDGTIEKHGPCYKHVAIPRIVLREHSICRQTGGNGRYFQFLPTSSIKNKWRTIPYIKNAILSINDKSAERKQLRATMNKFFELSLNNKDYQEKTWLESYDNEGIDSDVSPMDYFHESNQLNLSFKGERYHV